MKRLFQTRLLTVGITLLMLTLSCVAFSSDIPLPEHPRPDFQRADWVNLNGLWDFRFDKNDEGIEEKWYIGRPSFNQEIMVPFPWGSPLSQVSDDADIGWYRRSITVPEEWKSKRVFLIIGASDWETTIWLDGKEIGTHQGGYIPFEFELGQHITYGKKQTLVIRADDTRRDFQLYGKQGYGNARGIWQTPYLEARGSTVLDFIQFTPNLKSNSVHVEAQLLEPAKQHTVLSLAFTKGSNKVANQTITAGQQRVVFDVGFRNPRLWSLEDPFLFELVASLDGGDKVNTYFGMREISVVNLPGTEFPYVALNGKPVYLKMALDQAYHPEGYYTFPSDEFTRDEVLLSRRIGLNTMRVHVKTPLPRKLYWADKLGILIMADIPNSWGQPDEAMRNEIDKTMRQIFKRDFNHPSIFSWVIFNETWGLKTDDKGYLPETQEWVVSMVKQAKQLDPSRLVEDNSPCLYDHTITDLNTWHAYLPGYEWDAFLDNAVKKTFPGSDWNFAEGYTQQKNQPMLNSECGNVWGYDGSTGDIDWSWDYHIMMDAFRRHPSISGWLYTEHHDVINEWNGYFRYDRSLKFTGMEELADGMSLRDLHSDIYISSSPELCQEVKAGESVSVPLYASFLTDQKLGPELTLTGVLSGWDILGRKKEYGSISTTVPYKPWNNTNLTPINVRMPDEECVAILTLTLCDAAGAVLHRNFTTFLVSDGSADTMDITQGKMRLLRVKPDQFTNAEWSQKQWNILDGLKVNGAGSGFVEYTIPWPSDLKESDVQSARFLVEASAKRLNGKDVATDEKMDDNYMLGKGEHDPSRNPNAYPMTDEILFPSAVSIIASGIQCGQFDLLDDPADHRGILSWQSQPRDRKLREAGSYGYLISTTLPQEAISQAIKTGKLTIRLQVDESFAGGLAIYGNRFGRYPLDPTIALQLR